MKEISDLTRNELEELVAEYQGFAYAFRNSFLNDYPYIQEVFQDVEEVVEDYATVILCFNSMSTSEDKILNSGWLGREIDREFE